MSNKKIKHIDACLLNESQYNKSAGFEEIDLGNESTAGLSLNNISLSLNFLGKNLKAPLMIAPMTGGMEKGAMLNERFAKAAQYFGLAFGVGSQRLALENTILEKSFEVRKYAPDILLFANLGAAQIVHNLTEEKIKRAIDMIGADGLFIHLNPLQEVLQENGDTDFKGLLKALEKTVKFLRPLGIKVLVREVCFGLSKKAALDLLKTGIDGIDCAGAGGTSWAKVEGLCAKNLKFKRIAEVFGEWGIPTVQSIKNVREINKDIPLIATGGIRSGLDIAKCLYLGANLASMAQPMLIAALKSEEALFDFIDQTLQELKIAIFASKLCNLCNFNRQI